MKFIGKEKYFWESNFNIKRVDQIPEIIESIKGIDSDHDDQFFEYLVKRVKTIRKIHLRCTFLTDAGVMLISQLQGLQELTLKDHRGITAKCLPCINRLTDLVCLDISKNSFDAEGVLQLDKLTKLKELIVSSDNPDPLLRDKLEAHFPGCRVTVY